MYDLGKGVRQDYAMARMWYEKAAAQGNGWAQSSLGFLYAEGLGVPQDYVKAYMWYSLATAHSTSDLQKSAASNRDKFALFMTVAQIAEAQKLSQQCQAQQFKGCSVEAP